VPFAAFLLVSIAAIAHSSWNLLAKRAGKNINLIWFSSLGEVVIFLPLALWALKQSQTWASLRALEFLLATGVLHVFYTECLLRAYRAGDLSLVYPLARGTGPLLSFLGAILILSEHPTLLATLGALLVSFGIFLLSSATRLMRSKTLPAGLVWGGLTGMIIAGYTLTDAYSVKVLALAPVLVEYAGNFFRTIVLTPRAWEQRAAVLAEYKLCWRESLGISILTPLGYILVLFAMKIAPVSRIAPVREMSMLIAAYFGAKMLGEGFKADRIIGTVLITAGVVMLTFS
jgi:uncharacterized membrane protein